METRILKINGQGTTTDGVLYNIDIELEITGETKLITVREDSPKGKKDQDQTLAYTTNINKCVCDIDNYELGGNIERICVKEPNTTSIDEIFFAKYDDEDYYKLVNLSVEMPKLELTITNVAPSKSTQQVETAQAMFSNLLDKVSEATTVAEARGAARTAEIFNHKYLQDAMANIF